MNPMTTASTVQQHQSALLADAAAARIARNRRSRVRRAGAGTGRRLPSRRAPALGHQLG